VHGELGQLEFGHGAGMQQLETLAAAERAKRLASFLYSASGHRQHIRIQALQLLDVTDAGQCGATQSVAAKHLLLELPGFFAKFVSLALRLYGNFFAGEVIFLVIALLGYWQLPLHFGWSVFHILVVTLQAYLFMMLTIVYMNQAHQSTH
jgi:hypothetical protein